MRSDSADFIPAGAHEDFPAIEVLETMLTDAPSGRLYKLLVESKKASSVNGNSPTNSFSRCP